MSDSSTAASVMDQHAALCQEYISRSVERLKENLELLLGQAAKIEVSNLGLEADEALRKRLPADAVCLSLTHPEVETGPALLVMEPALAHSLLAITRVVPADELPGIRESASPSVSDEDRASFDELAGFFAASFTDEARARRGDKMTLDPQGVRTLDSSSWDGDEDPLGTHAYLVADGTMRISSQDDAISVLVPEAMMSSLIEGFKNKTAGAPPASNDAAPAADEGEAATESKGPETLDLANAPEAVSVAAGESFVLVLGPESSGGRLKEALGTGVTCVSSLSAIVAQFEKGPAPDLIIAQIGAQDDHLLPWVAACQKHPDMKGKGVMVLLDSPTRSRVLRCASLGLLNVLPAQEEVSLIAARCKTLLPAAASAS